ncbi:hypothetical protein V8C40DRAFT_260264 [Trichoderma camerunense]
MKTQFISLEYIADLDLYKLEKPYFLTQIPGFEAEESTNLKYSTKDGITLSDCRGHESEFTLDTHSFSFDRVPLSVDYDKTTQADTKYMRDMVEYAQERFQADRVICYDIRRRLDVPMTKENKASNDRSLPAPAVTAIHIDGGFHRIKRHLSDEEQTNYLNGGYRVRIINIWRPLFRNVTQSPLAFCDTRTLHESDLVPADRVSPEYAGEIYYVRPSTKQRWYWLSEMTPDEIAVFVSFDSAHADVQDPINYCAHASFLNPQAPAEAPPRESLEIRLIVITKKEDQQFKTTMDPIDHTKASTQLQQPWKSMISVPKLKKVEKHEDKEIRLQPERDQHNGLGG